MLEEARFEEGLKRLAFDHTLTSLSNPIRRNILRLLSLVTNMRLIEIARELNIEDHTKVAFHLKVLKEGGIIGQDKEERSYFLTEEGKKTLECLRILENYLST